MRFWLAALLLGVWCSAAIAAPVKVAVPSAGGKRSGKAKIRAAMVAAMAQQGAQAITSGDAELEIRLTVKKAPKRRFVAEAQLLGSDGRLVRKAKATFGKGGANKAGAQLGKALGRAAVAERDRLAAEKMVAAAPEVANEPLAPEPIRAPEPPPPPSSIVPKDEIEARTEGPPKEAAGEGGEDQLLRITLGAGTQLLSAYTVAVNGQVTGLAYDLSPLFLVSGGARLRVPGTGLAISLSAGFVPVRYAVDIPPLAAYEPTGRFLSVGGDVAYELVLSELGEGGRFALAPLLSGTYAAMSVEEQGDNTVILSYSGIDLLAGVQVGLVPNPNLALEADLRGGLIVGYGESPTRTGESASGFALRLGGNARYWVNGTFGVHLGVAYHFRQVGFTGPGTRVGFVEDPVLVDATVFSGDLQIQTGVLLAL